MSTELIKELTTELDSSSETIAKLILALESLEAEIKRLKALHSDIVGELYGKDFEVAGWHLNGDLEKLDNWFEEHGWLDADEWKPASGEAGEG